MVVLRNDYSQCPLKKRPLSICYENAGGEQTEPQDLSLKCGKEAPPVPPEDPPFVENIYLHEPHIHRTQDVVAGAATSINSDLLHLTTASLGEGLHSEDILPRSGIQNTPLAGDSRIKSVSVGQPPMQNVMSGDASFERRYAQVIYAQGSSLQEFKGPLASGDPLPQMTVSSVGSRPAATREAYTSSKHLSRRRNLGSQGSGSSSRCGFEGKKARSEKVHPTSVVPLGTLSSPLTCSQDLPLEITPTGSENQTSRIPTLSIDQLSQARVPTPLETLSSSGPTHVESAVSTSHAKVDLSTKCTSSLSAPHRPWLSEGPQRSPLLLKPYSDIGRIPLGQQTHHPRSLLVGPPSLWAGMVPFSWSVPHVLATPPQPFSSRGHQNQQQRDCYSPSSESASSDGSSSSSRNESRYSCPDCNKSYSTYSGLSKHKQFHCVALGAKSFACKHCDKVYTSLGALKMHIRTHTLPCKCPLCGKAFSRPWLLQGHIRTHTGEKPFQCPQCDRCFADRSNLRAHLQTHADVKKYACSTCHKTFSRMSLLNKHVEAACPAAQRRQMQ